MGSVIVKSAGMLTTVQDKGRYGYQRFGMPVSGAMDPFSFALANIIVGNRNGEACLEATVTGPELLFTGDSAVAVCGADMGPLKNGVPVGLNTIIFMKRGDLLTFSGLRSGCRSYIAFSGGIDVPVIMGSRSTYLRAGIGGYMGRALKTGDELKLGEPAGIMLRRNIPDDLLPAYDQNVTVRICRGPEAHMFNRESTVSLVSSEYLVTEHSDRMGYRLSGKTLDGLSAREGIISAGVTAGTIQVPGDGQPVILMADRQTTGGYLRIANVISTDLTFVAQMLPGNSISFREVSLKEARDVVYSLNRIMLKLQNI